MSETLNQSTRQAGVCLHLTSLPGPFGIGDIADRALSFVDTLVEMGISVWQFLPTGPTAYGDSPYQPLSVFAGNELLVGLEPLIRLGLISSAEAAGLDGLPSAHVAYESVIPKKMAVLSAAAERFSSQSPSTGKI